MTAPEPEPKTAPKPEPKPEPLTEQQLDELRAELAQLPDVQSTMTMLLRQLQMQRAVPKLLEEIARQRHEIARWKADVNELYEIHNRGWHLLDGLAEDLGNHSPVAHPEYIEQAESWLQLYPLHKYPVE